MDEVLKIQKNQDKLNKKKKEKLQDEWNEQQRKLIMNNTTN